jgi:hypothetical protein
MAGVESRLSHTMYVRSRVLISPSNTSSMIDHTSSISERPKETDSEVPYILDNNDVCRLNKQVSLKEHALFWRALRSNHHPFLDDNVVANRGVWSR